MRQSIIILLLFLTTASSQGQSKAEPAKPYSWTFSPRLNSAGYFPFTGALLNHNTNFDLTVAFEKNNYGFILFQSFDLKDKRSSINYFQPAVFRKFAVSRSVMIGVYAGYLFSQTHSFKDKGGSDYFAALSQHWDINKQLRLENTMLFGDLTLQPKLIDRLLLRYKIKKINVNFYLHERALFQVKDLSTSAAIAVDLPALKIADRLSIQATITYQSYLTKHRPDYALKNGLFLSLAFPFSINK